MSNQAAGRPGLLAAVETFMARRVPWWTVLVLGIACVAVGVWLLAEPFRSLSVLHWLVVAGLILSGVAELATAEASPRPWLSRLIGVGWIVVGVVAASWPGITILALAIAVGVALVAGGVIKFVTALFGDGDERFILGISGLTNVIVGLLALTWPAVTVLVLAVIFGLRTIVFGIGQIALAFRVRRLPADAAQAGGAGGATSRWPGWLRLTGAVTVLALALGGLAISVAVHRAAPGEPGRFYSAPSPLPDGAPGTIIRTEVIDGFHEGATTYRVLYKSTGYDGAPTAVSGIIVVADSPTPPEGRKVIAFTHGTVGVATNCSPSNQGRKAIRVYEGLDEFVAAGYVVAATDYQGLGTPGPHPYLVGNAEAMNALDSVRAARNLSDADAGTDFAVWGHSQGGQASLFTGQLAASYAPELHLVGVAVGAPAANLVELFEVNIQTTVGKILMSMALQSWARVYDDANLDQIVTPAARPAIARIAANCLYDPNQILASVPSSLLLGFTFISTPPWEVEPWETILAENTPGATPTRVPMIITQGSIDPIVAPDVTAQLATALCANGETVDYRVLPGIAHHDAGHVAAPDVAAWIADRFTDKPAPSTCKSS
ncbi:MAG: lipase family protein [Acidimicrobiales bacterium]